MPRVNPNILLWARETAGLTLEDAADRLQIRAARGRPPSERLRALESGDDEPTRALLVRMTQQYRRPLLTFYLSSPPSRGDRGEDFRTLPDTYSGVEDNLLDVLIRNIRARQSMVRSLIEDEEDVSPLPFVGSMFMSDGTDAVLESIQETLQIRLSSFRDCGSPLKAFALLRDAAESAGVFVLLKGDLGNYHTAIDVETFRGFSIADPIAPFLVINDQDSKAAWSFTLLHELTHVWLGQTGVGGANAERDVERFCNDVASEFLLPQEELVGFEFPLGKQTDARALLREVSEFAQRRNVSGSMVAYGLFRAGVIDSDAWAYLSEAFSKLWAQQRQQEREKAREQEGGPNYYVVRRHRLGSALTEFVGRMVAEGALTTTKAATVLGVKAKQVEKVVG